MIKKRKLKSWFLSAMFLFCYTLYSFVSRIPYFVFTLCICVWWQIQMNWTRYEKCLRKLKIWAELTDFFSDSFLHMLQIGNKLKRLSSCIWYFDKFFFFICFSDNMATGICVLRCGNSLDFDALWWHKTIQKSKVT